MNSIRECIYLYPLDMKTLVWTRDARLPLSDRRPGSNVRIAAPVAWR
jgi:hypothetical protein